MNDDLISRHEAVHAFDYCLGMNRVQAQDILMRLPSVNPQKTQMIDKSNFDQEQYKSDLQCAYDCGKASVNPQEPKIGHWILDETDNSITCDKCGCLIWANDISNGEAYYCPNCGCRMVEPQESEEISDRNMKMWEEIFKAESDHKCHTCKHYTSGEHDGSCGSYICKGYSNWESEGEK